MRADAESSCTESRTDSWSQDGARSPWSAPTTELWTPTRRTRRGPQRPGPRLVQLLRGLLPPASCMPSQRASTNILFDGRCRSSNDCEANPPKRGDGLTLPVSASHNSSLTGTSSLQPHAGLWEPYDGRLSRTVLTEREGEVPSRHSPGSGPTAAATANSTERCTPSPSPAAATAPTPRPTSQKEPPKAKPPEKPNAASNATSPARSTASSNTPKSTLDKHRSIVSAKAQQLGRTLLGLRQAIHSHRGPTPSCIIEIVSARSI